jgi:hypothetical protein
MYIIKDWADNTLFDGELFETFEDAWDFIYCTVADEDCAYDDIFVYKV